MKQLSLMLLLIASSSSFAIRSPLAPSYGMKRSEQLDPTQVNKPSPQSGKRKPRSSSFDLPLPGKSDPNRRPFIEFVLVAREPGETRPPSGMFRHFKVVPDENH